MGFSFSSCKKRRGIQPSQRRCARHRQPHAGSNVPLQPALYRGVTPTCGKRAATPESRSLSQALILLGPHCISQPHTPPATATELGGESRVRSDSGYLGRATSAPLCRRLRPKSPTPTPPEDGAQKPALKESSPKGYAWVTKLSLASLSCICKMGAAPENLQMRPGKAMGKGYEVVSRPCPEVGCFLSSIPSAAGLDVHSPACARSLGRFFRPRWGLMLGSEKEAPMWASQPTPNSLSPELGFSGRGWGLPDPDISAKRLTMLHSLPSGGTGSCVPGVLWFSFRAATVEMAATSRLCIVGVGR